MFDLSRTLPSSEGIMGVNSLLRALQGDSSHDVSTLCRTGRYGVYKEGFVAVGSTVVCVDNGLDYTFVVPKALQGVDGMLDFRLNKLQYDPDSRIVSVTSDFNLSRDVRVVGPIQNGNAIPDRVGYPKPSAPSWSDREIRVLVRDHFSEGENGWHGSIALNHNSYEGSTFDVSSGWSVPSEVYLYEKSKSR
jgi:hypothetical protein